jgi:hypothetical protein
LGSRLSELRKEIGVLVDPIAVEDIANFAVSFFFISVWAIVLTCFFNSKFMYLGQLLDDGEAAATCTRQGLALIEHQAAHGDEDAHDRMCGACCALAEQLMGTADEVEAVADECDSLLVRLF